MKTILQQSQIDKLYEFGISATRLTDLLSILPHKITDRQRIYNLEIGIWDSGYGWTICYRDRINDTDDLETYQEAEELIDAVYQELCFLKAEKIQTL